MVIIPVATVQVGCVTAITGAAGVGGCAFTIILVTGEMQLAAFCKVSVCGPVETPVYPPAG